MTRKLLSIMLALFMAFTVMRVEAREEEAIETDVSRKVTMDGQGTDEDPYQVATAYQLNAIRTDMSAHYIQVADIDISESEWNPVGDEDNPFTGTFDGNGFVISGLNINTSDYYVGLFGKCNNQAQIRNITLDNVNIDFSVNQEFTDSKNSIYVGGVVGYCGNRGGLTNCSVLGTITIDSIQLDNWRGNIGGIAGFGNPVSCINYSDINVEGLYAIICGGIVGVGIEKDYYYGITSFVKNCKNYGNIKTIAKSYNSSGGIGGYEGFYQNCTNYGNVYSEKTEEGTYGYTSCRVGGIAGCTEWGTIRYCFNYGNIYGKAQKRGSARVGGISGEDYRFGTGPNSDSRIENCVNAGIDIVSVYQLIDNSNGNYYDTNDEARRISCNSQYFFNNYSLDITRCNGEIPGERIGKNDENGEGVSETEIESLIASLKAEIDPSIELKDLNYTETVGRQVQIWGTYKGNQPDNLEYEISDPSAFEEVAFDVIPSSTEIEYTLMLTLKALKAGDYEVTVKNGNLSATTHVSVGEEEEYEILGNVVYCLRVGETTQYEYKILPEDHDFSSEKVTYFSTDPTVVSIDENGLMTAHKEGEVSVSVALSSLDLTCGSQVLVTSTSINDSFFVIGRDTNLFDHNDIRRTIKPYGYKGEGYILLPHHYAKLVDGMGKKQVDKLVDVMNSRWGGSCHGLSVTLGLTYCGLLDIKDYQTNNLKNYPEFYSDLNSPMKDTTLLSAINYYHLLQYTNKDVKDKTTLYNDLFANKKRFWSELAAFAEEQLKKEIPILFGFGWGENEGHTVLIVGFSQTDTDYVFQIYDNNKVKNFTYLCVNKESFDFHYYYGAPDASSYQVYGGLSSQWRYLKYYDLDAWTRFDTNLNSINATSANEISSSTIYIAPNSSFSLKTAEGLYFRYKDGIWEGDLIPENLDFVSDGSEIRFTIPASEAYILSDIAGDLDFDIVSDDEFYSICSSGASEIYIHMGKGIELSGHSIIYDIGVGTDEDDPSIIHMIGESLSKITFAEDNNQIVVSSNDENVEMTIKVLDQDGTTEKGVISGSETLIIDNRGECVGSVGDVIRTIHDFSEPQFIWSSDYTNCTARITCKEDGYIEEYPCSINTDFAETEINYTATVTIYGKEYSDLKTVSLIITPTVIELNKQEASIIDETTVQITATVLPEDADQTVTWSSSDESVASVDQTGLVTGLKAGLVTITATTSNCLAASCEVRVLFKDVADKDKYYYDSVYWALDNNITTGTSPSEFTPGENVTRGQMVTFLYRLAGTPGPKTGRSFDDVDPSRYYAKAITWAAENGITTGYAGTNKFGPDDFCTREQIVTFLWRYADTPKPVKNANFTDAKPGAYYLDALSWAAEKGITVGLNDGTGRFGVGQACTRGMCVTFLYRHANQ